MNIHTPHGPLVECVVNVSEGRNRDLLNRFKLLMDRPGQVHVLHTDIGYDTNRTVYTIAGILDHVCNAIEDLISDASVHLDIHKHEGTHPCIGIIDVVPFIPLKNISVEQLKEKVANWAERVALSFNLPIFFYGPLSTHPKQRTLHDLRKGGIRSLEKNIGITLIADKGPQIIHDYLGACAVTVRDYMIAYNINLRSFDLTKAKKLAALLIKKRSSYQEGDLLDIRDVKFLAWTAPEYNCCQISTNIYDLNKVKMLSLYRYVSDVAKSMNMNLAGSELIGLAPKFAFCTSSQNIDDAIAALKLDSVRPFNKEEQILDYQLSRINWNSLEPL